MTLRQNYVTELSDEELIEAAIKGMLGPQILIPPILLQMNSRISLPAPRAQLAGSVSKSTKLGII